MFGSISSFQISWGGMYFVNNVALCVIGLLHVKDRASDSLASLPLDELDVLLKVRELNWINAWHRRQLRVIQVEVRSLLDKNVRAALRDLTIAESFSDPVANYNIES